MIKFQNKVIMSMIRSSMNKSIKLLTRHNIIMISKNMIKAKIRSWRTYGAFVDGDAVSITGSADEVTMVSQMEYSRRR